MHEGVLTRSLSWWLVLLFNISESASDGLVCARIKHHTCKNRWNRLAEFQIIPNKLYAGYNPDQELLACLVLCNSFASVLKYVIVCKTWHLFLFLCLPTDGYCTTLYHVGGIKYSYKLQIIADLLIRVYRTAVYNSLEVSNKSEFWFHHWSCSLMYTLLALRQAAGNRLTRRTEICSRL
jgi:hypothetical protein